MLVFWVVDFGAGDGCLHLASVWVDIRKGVEDVG